MLAWAKQLSTYIATDACWEMLLYTKCELLDCVERIAFDAVVYFDVVSTIWL